MIDLNMDIKVGFGANVYDGTIKDILQINEGSLNDEFIKQPSLYAWFAALQAYAGAAHETKKVEFRVMIAKVASEIRQDAALKKDKITESKINQEVEQDKRISVLQEELIEKKREWEVIKSIVDALSQRKDMLIQLGSNKRQEFYADGVDIKKVRDNNRG